MCEGSERLHYGAYFGNSEVRVEVPGFSVALLTPSHRAEDVPLHTHPSASFVFVLSGAYASEADGAGQPAPRPMLIFNPAGTTHRDSFVEPKGRFLAISISDEISRLVADAEGFPTAARAFRAGSGLATASRLASDCALPDSQSTPAIESHCWELISLLSGSTVWPAGRRPSLPSWVAKARELLHDRCAETLSITALARELQLHPVYFSRAFRAAFRCTPAEYRMRCRLQRALVLSRDPRVSLADVALRAGFFDQSHFTRAFRREFGIAPSAYRKHLRWHASAARLQGPGSIGTRTEPGKSGRLG